MNIKTFTIRLNEEFLEKDEVTLNLFLENINVKSTTSHLITNENQTFWSIILFYETKKKSVKIENQTPNFEDLTQKQKQIFVALKQWRNNMAIKLEWAAYMICNNSQLIEIAIANPNTKEELDKVKGFGKLRTEKYGDDILAVLNAL